MAEDSKEQNKAPNQEKKRGGTVKWVIGGIVALFVVLLAFGAIPRWRHNRAMRSDAAHAATALPQVNVISPHPASPPVLNLPGNTQAIEDAVLGARTSGYIKARYADIGDHVRAGQVLAEIESPDVDQQLYQAQAQTAQSVAGVRQAQADVANKQATVAQYRSNVKQAQANLEQARAQYANAVARLHQAEHNVGIKTAALEQAKTQRNLAKVTRDRYNALLKAGYVALQDVDQAEANYKNAEAAVNSAEADLLATEAAVKSAAADAQAYLKSVGAAAATVNSNQATVKAAQAAVRQSEANVDASRSAVVSSQANAGRFKVLTSFEKIVAPFDGVVTARNTDVGALISSGGGSEGSSGGSGGGSTVSGASSNGATTTAAAGSASISSSLPNTTPSGGLFGVARIDTLRILVSVPETYAKEMHPGLTAQITLREFPGRTFTGQVTNVAGALDTTSRTLLVEIHLPNQEGTLLPGMYAQVQFHLPPPAQAVVRIPSNTLLVDGQGARVAVVTPDHKIHYQPVKIGRDYGAEVEITDGLRGQETLVAGPGDDLTEGEAVNPIAPPPGAPAPPPAPTQNGPKK